MLNSYSRRLNIYIEETIFRIHINRLIDIYSIKWIAAQQCVVASRGRHKINLGVSAANC